MIRRTLVALIILLSLGIQSDAQLRRAVQKKNTFAYYKTTTLSGAAEKVTLQQPASGHRSVMPKFVVIDSTVDTVWTLSVDGTAATGTAGTAISIGKNSTATGTVYHTSDAGAGSTLMVYTIAAADHPRTVDLSEIAMLTAGTANNISIGTDSITGDVAIAIVWEER